MSPQLSKLFSRSKNSLFLVSSDTFEIETCNSSALKDLGVPLEKITGKCIDEFYTLNIQRRQKILDEIAACGIYHMRDRISKNVVSVIRVNEEEKDKFLVSVEAKNQIKNSSDHTILEENVAGYIRINKDLVIIECNGSFAAQLGYKAKEQLINIDIKDVFLEADDVSKLVKLAIKDKKINNHEIRLKSKAGNEKIFLSNILLEKSDTGENEGLSFTVIDISSRVEFEKKIKLSEERFKLLSDVAIEGIVFLDKTKIVDCNNQLSKLLGFSSTEDLIQTEITEFINPSEVQKIINSIEKRSEILAKKSNGTIILLEATAGKIYQGEKEINVLLFYDITRRKKIEIALEQSTERYKNLVENSPNGVFILIENRIRFMNNTGIEFLGASSEDDLYKRNFLDFVSDEHISEFANDLTNTREGGELEYKEIALITLKGDVFNTGIQASLTIYNNKPAIQITVIDLKAQIALREERIKSKIAEETNLVLTEEIEQHKQTQEKLQEAQKFTRNIIESSIDMIIAIDKDGNITEFNQAAVRQFGYQLKEIVGKPVEVLYANPKEFKKVNDSIEKKKVFTGEIINKRKDGETFVSLLSSSVIMDKKGKVQGSMGVSRDITNRKIIEQQIKDSLKEKEVLLQEVHHRVKNNLQVISSILSLQSNYVKDEKTLEILDESQNRIKSMSYIHETLYQTTDFSSIEFSNYLDRLASNLIHSYSYSNGPISLQSDYDDIYLTIDQAIPCGLIVNELISNALKYAYDTTGGNIDLAIKENKGQIFLRVADYGEGLPKDFKYEESDSLGMQLVYSLVDQIDANMELNTSKKGTEFLITFERK